MGAISSTINSILNNLFTSASKLVFLMMAVALCIGFFMKLISQENFIYIVGSVFSYYFGVAQGSIGAQTTLPPQPPRDPEAPKPPAISQG